MDEKELDKQVKTVSEVLDIRVKDIYVLLQYISKNEPLEPKELLRKFGYPMVHFKKILLMFKNILTPPPNKIGVLNGNNIYQIVENKLNGIIKMDKNEVRNVLADLKKIRPKPDRQYDQFTATEDTTTRRALEMASNGDLYDKIVAFLGDDDLTSVAVGIAKQAKKIVVFEIDERITSLIDNISHKYNLGIEIVKQDLRTSFSKEYLSQFDVIFTDPPYTPKGISLFLNRGIELLKKKHTSRVYLCYGNSDRSRERELDIQRIISEKGLLINSKKYQFNKYYGAESIGSSSSLYLLDWTPKMKITQINSHKLYTNE